MQDSVAAERNSTTAERSLQNTCHRLLCSRPAAPLRQVWDLAKRSRTAAYTLAPPVPGQQRFKAARFVFSRNSLRSNWHAGAVHIAVYWDADAPGEADSKYVALYRLDNEDLGAAQHGVDFLAALPVCQRP